MSRAFFHIDDIGTIVVTKDKSGTRAYVVKFDPTRLYHDSEYRPDNDFYARFGTMSDIYGDVPVFGRGIGTKLLPLETSGSVGNCTVAQLSHVLNHRTDIPSYDDKGFYFTHHEVLYSGRLASSFFEFDEV